MNLETTVIFGIVTVVAYLLGSLPFAVWIARAHGVDIFCHGSGNPGATNVKRVLGRSAGNWTFLLDFGKGVLAVQWFRLIELPVDLRGAEWLPIAALIAAIAGHTFSVFLRFRGGKGVAVTMGGLLGIMPGVWLTAVLLWLLLYRLFRVVSLASVVFALALPFIAWGWAGLHGERVAPEILWLTGCVAVLIVMRHLSNLRRVLSGEEFRFVKKDSNCEDGGAWGESDSPGKKNSHGSGH